MIFSSALSKDSSSKKNYHPRENKNVRPVKQLTKEKSIVEYRKIDLVNNCAVPTQSQKDRQPSKNLTSKVFEVHIDIHSEISAEDPNEVAKEENCGIMDALEGEPMA